MSDVPALAVRGRRRAATAARRPGCRDVRRCGVGWPRAVLHACGHARRPAGALGIQLLRNERARPRGAVRHLVLLPRRVPPRRGRHRAGHALPPAVLLVVDAAWRTWQRDRLPVPPPLARPAPGHLPPPYRHRRADRPRPRHRTRALPARPLEAVQRQRQPPGLRPRLPPALAPVPRSSPGPGRPPAHHGRPARPRRRAAGALLARRRRRHWPPRTLNPDFHPNGTGRDALMSLRTT